MKQKNELIKNTIYLYLLMFVKVLFPVISLPYLARVLSIDMYGTVAYVKAYVTYIQLLLDFGFLLSATKYISLNKVDKIKIGYCVGDTIIEKSILAIIGTLVTLILSYKIEILYENQLFIWLYYLSSVMTIFIPDFLYRGIEKMEYAAIPLICSKTIVLVLTFILIKSSKDYLLIPILEMSGNAIAAIISFGLLKKVKVRLFYSGIKQWISDLRESSVYFFSNFATTFFGALTTLIVGIYMEKVEIAYWSLCMQFVSAAKSMYSPLVNSLYPYMMKHKCLKTINRIAFGCLIPLATACLVVLLGGENIMIIVGGHEYEYAGHILKYLIPVFVASFYSMLYGWPVLGAINKVKATTYSTISSAIIQIMGILLLICSGRLTLITLAICCSVSEVSLLIIRGSILLKNRNMLNEHI